jgi:hypothetical protein
MQPRTHAYTHANTQRAPHPTSRPHRHTRTHPRTHKPTLASSSTQRPQPPKPPTRPPKAALGYVASKSEGFVDLDALPEDGASAAEVLRFVLSEEARDLRPLLVSWIATGADLLIRDRARKALALAPSLAPRLPFVGALPLPPPPPVFLPGRGLVPLGEAVDMLAPPLDAEEGVYLQSLVELAAGVLGVPAAQLDAPDLSILFGLITRPGAQARELAAALAAAASPAAPGGGGGAGGGGGGAAAAAVAADVADAVAATLAARAGVPLDTLFPLRAPVLARVRAQLPTPAPSAAPSAAGSLDSFGEDEGAPAVAGAAARQQQQWQRPPSPIQQQQQQQQQQQRQASPRPAVAMRPLQPTSSASSMDEAAGGGRAR